MSPSPNPYPLPSGERLRLVTEHYEDRFGESTRARIRLAKRIADEEGVSVADALLAGMLQELWSQG